MNLMHLPCELRWEIYSYLPVRDLLNSALVCKKMREDVCDTRLLQFVLRRDFGSKINKFPDSQKPIVVQFGELYCKMPALGEELREAAEKGRVEDVMRLLREGAPINWNDKKIHWRLSTHVFFQYFSRSKNHISTNF